MQPDWQQLQCCHTSEYNLELSKTQGAQLPDSGSVVIGSSAQLRAAVYALSCRFVICVAHAWGLSLQISGQFHEGITENTVSQNPCNP